MIKCPCCRNEYSYGKFIFHKCENSSICFGSIFSEKQKEYKWNCASKMNCNNSQIFKKVDSSNYIFE